MSIRPDAYFSFDELNVVLPNSGYSAIVDASRRQNGSPAAYPDGVAGHPPLIEPAPGTIGYSMLLNGTIDTSMSWVNLHQKTFGGLSASSITFWFKTALQFDGTAVSDNMLIWENSSHALWLQKPVSAGGNGKFYFANYHQTTGWVRVESATVAAPNTTYFIATTRSEDTGIALYINAVQEAANTTPFSQGSTGSDRFKVGINFHGTTWNPSGGAFGCGYYDEFAYWGYPGLTAAQVKSIYRSYIYHLPITCE